MYYSEGSRRCQGCDHLNKYFQRLRALVVAQLVDQLLLTPDICSSNPVISRQFIHCQLYGKHKQRKKAKNVPF